MKLSNICIYVKDINEFIELQKYLFNQEITWIFNYKKLYKTWCDGSELSFPRHLMINDKYMYNVGMNEEDRLYNTYKLKEINGTTLLRQLKLKKLNENR